MRNSRLPHASPCSVAVVPVRGARRGARGEKCPCVGHVLQSRAIDEERPACKCSVRLRAGCGCRCPVAVVVAVVVVVVVAAVAEIPVRKLADCVRGLKSPTIESCRGQGKQCGGPVWDRTTALRLKATNRERAAEDRGHSSWQGVVYIVQCVYWMYVSLWIDSRRLYGRVSILIVHS